MNNDLGEWTYWIYKIKKRAKKDKDKMQRLCKLSV